MSSDAAAAAFWSADDAARRMILFGPPDNKTATKEAQEESKRVNVKAEEENDSVDEYSIVYWDRVAQFDNRRQELRDMGAPFIMSFMSDMGAYAQAEAICNGCINANFEFSDAMMDRANIPFDVFCDVFVNRMTQRLMELEEDDERLTYSFMFFGKLVSSLSDPSAFIGNKPVDNYVYYDFSSLVHLIFRIYRSELGTGLRANEQIQDQRSPFLHRGAGLSHAVKLICRAVMNQSAWNPMLYGGGNTVEINEAVMALAHAARWPFDRYYANLLPSEEQDRNMRRDLTSIWIAKYFPGAMRFCNWHLRENAILMALADPVNPTNMRPYIDALSEVRTKVGERSIGGLLMQSIHTETQQLHTELKACPLPETDPKRRLFLDQTMLRQNPNPLETPDSMELRTYLHGAYMGPGRGTISCESLAPMVSHASRHHIMREMSTCVFFGGDQRKQLLVYFFDALYSKFLCGGLGKTIPPFFFTDVNSRLVLRDEDIADKEHLRQKLASRDKLKHGIVVICDAYVRTDNSGVSKSIADFCVLSAAESIIIEETKPLPYFL